MSTTYMLKESAPKRFGVPVQFGCDTSFLDKPIVNLPEDAVKVRRRIRAHEMARVFVKTTDGTVTCYYAGPDGPDALKLLWTMGANKRERVAL